MPASSGSLIETRRTGVANCTIRLLPDWIQIASPRSRTLGASAVSGSPDAWIWRRIASSTAFPALQSARLSLKSSLRGVRRGPQDWRVAIPASTPIMAIVRDFTQPFMQLLPFFPCPTSSFR
jgi:hypothetical protein